MRVIAARCAALTSSAETSAGCMTHFASILAARATSRSSGGSASRALPEEAQRSTNGVPVVPQSCLLRGATRHPLHR